MNIFNIIMFRSKFSSFVDREIRIIGRMIRDCSELGGVRRLLDVGCGYGRNLQYQNDLGLTIVGVDANHDAVEYNRARGFECYLPDAKEWRSEYDCILMSHIIEHFSPTDLVEFMDGYLAHLRPGGHLVIASPLMTEYFFDDFTHIKPYPPESILMIFGDGNRQVSMRSGIKLELRDLWFRTSAFKIRRTRACYLGRFGKSWIRLLNGGLALAHLVTFGLLGKEDGWVGVFKKIG
jgi:2-polyprenyl-3-methyl-5-hydroxy-6-metoxy-1,4-benzoquinol methylase